MSQRQTQSVSPLARVRNRSTIAKSEFQTSQMPRSESQGQSSRNNTPGSAAPSNDDQTIINLLKTIAENQNASVSSFCHGSPPHCHCQMHPPNECQTQIQNQSSLNNKVDSAAINEESSIKTLLLAFLKNQTQQNSAWNQCPTYIRLQPTMHPCQMLANHCQHQKPNQSVKQTSTPSAPAPAAATKEEDPFTRSMLMTILEKQNKMAAQVEKLIQMQEVIMKRLDGLPLLHSVPVQNRINFKKIDTVQECHDFEENLKNFEYAQNMIKHFESVCGGSSELYGDNVAYTLIDQIFTRRLFTLVTWTGVSRGTESKESFLQFERIFQFFFDLIRKSDSEYSIKALKDFFQKIISNSKRRFEHKRARISRVKHNFKRKKLSLPNHEITYVMNLHNSNNDREEEIITDEITDNDDDYKDNISILSNECNNDEVETLDVMIKAEEDDEEHLMTDVLDS
ncbi:uncharacterized protein LOC129914471 [Episyrphus balteatus]|uniref:uncharacterized protein LOC129914471 n=1 Tax=Episyrphus balteatus TaxID=286459 RepID=UPI002485110E|nr:uncharacterized protein LOC129914471 [Episyrphus balteatus]